MLIGRLAVSKDFQGHGIGSEILDFLKIWFSDSHNKTACRFLAVDAYNAQSVLKFYGNNEFSFIFKSENEERASLQLHESEPLRTRMMCCDLFPKDLKTFKGLQRCSPFYIRRGKRWTKKEPRRRGSSLYLVRNQ
ncbi:GNAT family N-acetyltransferase [uncultured Fibrobacter sp.]|uniref:GNAT family N-acetyltransferase n=1 Tax=uncultured Fibrobacter sp. TaxID=261512 RepID=UPI00345C3F53